MEWANAIVQGVLLGGLYALLAAGLSLMFGVMRLVNLAHGALAIVAAYAGLVLVQKTGMPPFASIVIVVPLMAILGWVLQRTLLNTALNRQALAPILVTFGLAVIIQNLLLELFTADNQSIDVGSLASSSIQITPDIAIGVFPLITFIVGVLVIGLLQQYLARTATGRAMRATSDDREAAELMGIDNKYVYSLATAISLGLVGIAGVFLGIRTQFNPTFGDATLIFAFEAVIIGGLGSLWGTLAGGMILGIAQTVGAQAFPSSGVLLGHVVFLLVLAFRPTGLFPKVVNG
ncbi:MAG: branched-chain amino acid ABC transporter permease [Actinomycetes bacterium]|jgi:branched-chain amino acid transport system permease protein